MSEQNEQIPALLLLEDSEDDSRLFKKNTRGIQTKDGKDLSYELIVVQTMEECLAEIGRLSQTEPTVLAMLDYWLHDTKSNTLERSTPIVERIIQVQQARKEGKMASWQLVVRSAESAAVVRAELPAQVLVVDKFQLVADLRTIIRLGFEGEELSSSTFQTSGR